MTAQPTVAHPVRPAPYRPAPVPPAPRRRRTGRVLAALAAVAVLAGLAVAAQQFLLTTRTVQPAAVAREIARTTQDAVQVTPADVDCPAGIAVQAGGTFTCTGTVDGQPVTWWVHQDDDRGALTVTSDRLLRLDALERSVAAKVSADQRTPVTVDCGPAGRTVLRNTPGQPVDCTGTRAGAGKRPAAAPLALTVTVDEDGAVGYRLR